jgi:hypothetical protein
VLLDPKWFPEEHHSNYVTVLAVTCNTSLITSEVTSMVGKYEGEVNW